MKKYLSVMTLASRTTFYKLVALLSAMVAVESALFIQTAGTEASYSLEALIEESHLPLISGLFFLALCGLLSLSLIELSGSKTQYTLKRLTVREVTITSLCGLYNVFCLTLFWAVQVILALGLCHWYLQTLDPAYVNDQTILLAFYRNWYLHALLPLDEGSLWLRNITMLIALGITSASFSHYQRRQEKKIAIILLALLTFVSFPSNIGNLTMHVLVTTVAFSTTAYTFVNLYRRAE